MKDVILYHGTTKGYHDKRICEFQRYQHILDRIALADFLSTPLGYAIQRARDFRDTPLVLIVKASRITSNLTFRSKKYEWECDFLEPEWYRSLEIGLREGKVAEETLYALEQSAACVLDM